MRRGFTLIELLIVIGILAILAVVVILVLNPAQLLAQARDTQRISDLNSVKSAIGLYLTSTSSPSLGTTATCTASGCEIGGPFGSESVTSSTVVTGTGWVQVNLTEATGGSSLAVLPLDPTNSSIYFYAYKADNTNKTFELDARLESTKYYGLMATDGGNKSTCTNYTESSCYYEIGTDPGLDL
jgi:prepilin-type N-terminal cleavage/methylation domain-containing protein